MDLMTLTLVHDVHLQIFKSKSKPRYIIQHYCRHRYRHFNLYSMSPRENLDNVNENYFTLQIYIRVLFQLLSSINITKKRTLI